MNELFRLLVLPFGTLFLYLCAVLSRLCHFVLNLKLTSFKLLIHLRLPLCLLRTDLLDVDLITDFLMRHRLMPCALDTGAIEVANYITLPYFDFHKSIVNRMTPSNK